MTVLRSYLDRLHRVILPLREGDDPERGDVPGWVLITLMTAALVAAIWAVANEALTQLFEQAMQRFAGR
ncbi:hypothetical protein [Schaalia canis]|uniref:Uncharacterized protein n=1 Tax=Schaalia canis TaxID=100469 RepID=A0A3P1SEA9_9ACTO|nr:hypothetical protein [Schaalia canis]RRC95240.1 hypothetical protein EII11_06290 [Schaalia canis]